LISSLTVAPGVAAVSDEPQFIPMANPFIELKGVYKSYGSVNALSDVNLTIEEGRVLGLIGDNGAGKSTLIKLIAGVHEPDRGEMWVKGRKVSNWSVAHARAAGIETVFQDRALAEQQSIARNIFMGRELTNAWGLIDVKRQREEAERLMREIGFTSKVFSPDSRVMTLSGGERQGVAIARAIYFKAQLVILDEPTTALSLTESEKVFAFVRQLRARGAASIFISHNIYHSYDVSDYFAILDRGTIVYTADKSEVASADVLIRKLQTVARHGTLDIEH
jgi:simple sugar transport system ATP-binding protein